MDIYLKAPTEAALYTALKAAGIVTQGEDGYALTNAHAYALDVIGTIYRPTGEVIEQDGMEVQVTAPLDGFHANLRVMDASSFDPDTLADMAIDPPRNPARGWA